MNAIQKYFSLMQPDSYFFIGNMMSNEKQYYKAKDIVNMDFSGKTNVFFTPNSLGYRYEQKIKKSRINRDRNHLDKLCCLYCDIDLKDADDCGITVDEFMSYAKYHIIGSEIPEPTMINCSGNGVHMYWLINPISYRGNLEKYDAMQNYIYEVFKSFGADHKVASDKVRLLRVPDTINKKDIGVTKSYNISFSGITYELQELMQEYEVSEKGTVIKFESKERTNNTKNHKMVKNSSCPSFIFEALYRKRAKDLENLLLNHRDYNSSGRENILFLYRYYQCHINQDTHKALESTLELNDRLSHPLSKKEVERATESAQGYYKGNQLNWRNSKIIDFLSISNEEMKGMRTLINHTEKLERKRSRNKKYYQAKLQEQGRLTKRDAVILRQQELYNLYFQGKDRFEICRLLNISKSTYYADLKVINTEEWKLNFKDKQIEHIYYSEENEKTGTEDCVGFKNMPEHGAKTIVPKNSASVIICDCVYSVRGRIAPLSSVRTHCYIRGKPYL